MIGWIELTALCWAFGMLTVEIMVDFPGPEDAPGVD